jgi:hypothetical protein
MILRFVFLMILSIGAGTASGQAPVPVVERTVAKGNVTTRVSLFSNRVVVVSVRRGGEHDFIRRITLPENQYMVYLESFITAAEELDQQPITSEVETSTAEVAISLHIGPDAPRMIRFSPMSTVKLPLARIQGAFDDLQLQVLEASPSAEAMRTWLPAKGDRVELMNGTKATVVEVWDEGLLILEHDLTYVRESVPPEVRDQIILRVLKDEP